MPNPRDDAPLIATALLAPETFSVLDALRRRHFPVLLNRVPAHISLFHRLPGGCTERVVETARLHCRGRRGLDLLPSGVRFLGRGVAILYEGGDLTSLRATLAREWADWLTPQDRQPFKPHVTIQNKAAPDEARALFETMKAASLPACHVEGIAIWRYLGGPWEAVASCPFTA